jgi:putative heme-binding domain-containing protein
MSRTLPVASFVLLLSLVCTSHASLPPGTVGLEDPQLSWIWTGEAKTAASLPAGTRWFRKSFVIDRPIANPVDDAILEITADNGFTVWFNGVQVGTGSDWKRMYRFDVKPHAVHGINVIAVTATNEGPSPAGLLVQLTTTPNGKTKIGVPSDGSWKASRTEPPAGWQKPIFKDKEWESAHPVASYGSQPWGTLAWDDAPSSNRFKVPAGFVVDTVVPAQPDAPDLDAKLPFSLINMTFDAKGRLLVAQERGPVLMCTIKEKDGELKGNKIEYTLKPYCKQVKGAQGLCWVRDALLVVGDGPQGTGLYRAKDTNDDDVVDDVKLMHKFKGGMGEHGPHAILHGPDDWLYVVIGNHAWAQPVELAKNSPLTRWPKGTFGPDQGQPNTTEDVLLPRLNDGRGHAANILAPGGTIWRMDHEGKNLSLVAAGFRNHYDAAFNAQGELFTFDSDMEWDEGLPWYRPVRVCHCPPGADYVWRTGAANTPYYYLDSLEPLAETGRGSPVGVAFYDHHQFPGKYRGAFFLGDWSMGTILAVHLKPHGSSYQGVVEKFCVGTPLNVTDLETGPDGCLYFTLGGRGTAGGIYRIRHTGHQDESKFGSPQPLASWSSRRSSWKNPHLNPPSTQECREDLTSGDPVKQRRACEAIIRFGYEPPLDEVWTLLRSSDQFLRTSARLVLQRFESAKWVDRLERSDDLSALEGIVALCKTHQAASHAEQVYRRLAQLKPPNDALTRLYQLRTWQLAFIHAPMTKSEAEAKGALQDWFEQFPTGDQRINRELAILLTHAARSEWTDLPVHQKLLAELGKTSNDRQQQIHYFYCLRLLHKNWTPEQKRALLNWYENTKTWSGGHSFMPFLENILKDWLVVLTPEERVAQLDRAEAMPFVTLSLLRSNPEGGMPAERLLALFHLLARQDEMAARNAREAILENLGKQVKNAKVQQAVRELGDRYADQAEAVARLLAKVPSLENAPYLVRGLTSSSPIVLRNCIEALQKIKYQPKPEEGTAYRAVIQAVGRMNERDRLQAIKLLRQWKPQRFAAEEDDVQTELQGWSRWFVQAFPKEEPLPNVATLTAKSKWKMDELLRYLEQDPQGKAGDVARGKAVFAKANCLKCHKYGSEGEGIGPDLTTLKSRFKRADVLETILDPSKTISDQYRGTVIVTLNGQTITGLAAPQGDSITVLQIDGTKVTIKKSDVETQVASTVSPMPEKLLDELTLEEIADLFAYLESVPK